MSTPEDGAVQVSIDQYIDERVSFSSKVGEKSPPEQGTPLQEREHGMDRANANADEDWRKRAFQVVKSLCYSKPEFTADDVWDDLEEHEERTHDHRALGPVMMRAAKAGLCRNTLQHVRSRRPERHARPIPVWESTVRKRLPACPSTPPESSGLSS